MADGCIPPADPDQLPARLPLPAICLLPTLLALVQEGSVFRGTFDFEAAPFDWGKGYSKPDIPLQDLVVAELPVRLFTGGWVGR